MSLDWSGRISFLGNSFRIIKLNSVWAVLLLPLCNQARPWLRFSTQTSLFAALALWLVTFTRATLVVPALSWGERYSALK